MNIFKALFGGKDNTSPEKRKEEEDRRNFDILKYDGVKAMQTGRFDYAVQCMKHALQLREDLETRDYLSQAYIKTGNLSAAYKQLQKLAEAQPDNIEIPIRMAQVAYMMEDYTAMAEACEEALLIDDTDAESVYLYGRACVGQDDISNAKAMVTKAIMLNSNHEDAYAMRATILLEEGELEEAECDIEWLTSRATDNEDIMMLKARLEIKKGNDPEAEKWLDNIIDINPFCLAAYKERAALRMRKGDVSGAKEDELKIEEMGAYEGISTEENIEQKTQEAYNNSNPYFNS
ncbi:MAG: hypothetical protein UHZ01_08135 [Prevotella sp.]|nr:hypothetical protein [Prevotella sp.]